MKNAILTLISTFGLALPVLASPVVFNASATIQGGGSLSGTVTIDTATGTLLDIDLLASIQQTFVISANPGGIPNYANSGLYVITANTNGGYPVAVVGLNETSLEEFDGGPIHPASTINFTTPGDYYAINSGNLTLVSTTIEGGQPVSTFAATGTVDGSPISGGFVINTKLGTVLSSDLTVTIRRTYRLSSNIGAVPNYSNSGFLALIANEEAGGYPISLLGLPINTLTGYAGGQISGVSGLFLDSGTRLGIEGTLSPTPEPATLASVSLAAGLLILARRRRG